VFLCGGSRAVAWFWSWPCSRARNVPPCSGVVSVDDMWCVGAALAVVCLAAWCAGLGICLLGVLFMSIVQAGLV
jgi:hypothetical protein